MALLPLKIDIETQVRNTILKNSDGFGRALPPGWRVIPREMLYWAAPTWGEKKPCIDPSSLPRGRLDYIEGTKNTKAKTNNPSFTYWPAQKSSPDSSDNQKLLSVFDMRVLSELLELVRAQSKTTGDVLFFKPSEIIKSIGLQLSGSSYKKLERSLLDLASFRVESNIDSSQTEFLLSFAETRSYSCSLGALQTGDKRRLYWRVQFGKLIQRLMRHPSLFVSYPADVFKEAGRSPTAQWLCMFYFSHGHDGSIIFDHNLATLAEKANLPSQILMRMKSAIDLEAASKGLDAYDHKAKLEKAYQRGKKVAATRIHRYIHRLMSTSIFKTVEVHGASPTDPSKGVIRAARFNSRLEIFLSRFNAKTRSLIRSGKTFFSDQYARMLTFSGPTSSLIFHPVTT